MNYTLAGGLGQGKVASTADGGTALSTSAVTVMLNSRARQVNLIPRNYATAVVVKWRFVPWITVLKSTDLLATVANTTDYSNAAQDASTSTTLVLSSLAALADGGVLYVGSYQPIIGLVVDVQSTNSTSSTLTVKYRKSDNTWADISATDGTASGGATMAQDGNVTWTEPTDQIACRLTDVVSGIAADFGAVMGSMQFWLRLEVSAALDSSTTLNSLVAIPRATYAELPSGMTLEQAVLVGARNGPTICGVSALTDAGTANLIVNQYAANGAYIPS